MRKGFTVTLLAVAIAMLGSNAMAEAPVIKAIPDIIIGDADSGATNSNVFVYPDAIDVLDESVVEDDVTTNSELTWSYYAAPGTITINGAAPLVGTDDPVAPGSTKVVYGQGSANDDPGKVDAKINTLTFRNEALSPVATGGGAGPYAEPATTGLQGAGEVVTLYASDGDKASSATMLVYTDNNGTDGLSESGVVPDEEYKQNFATGGIDGWTHTEQGSVTWGTSGGLCLTTTATGDNVGVWDAPGGIIDLVDNAVYEIRVKMTSNAAANAGPLWDMIIDAQGVGSGAQGDTGDSNMYGADFWFYDNQYGANAVSGHTNGEFVMYFTPLRVNVPLWRSDSQGAFNDFIDLYNDMSLRFRLFDNDGSGYGSWTDSGQICLAEINVNRYDQSAFAAGSTVMDASSFSSTGYTMKQSDSTNGHTVWNSNGSVTAYNSATPTANASMQFMPGTGYDNPTGNTAAYVNSWPVPWVSNQILKVEYTLSGGGDDTRMPGVYMVMLDAPTVEYFSSVYSVSNAWASDTGATPDQAPKSGVQETWVAYFHSANASAYPDASGDGSTKVLRPTLTMFTNPSAGETDGQTGQTTIHRVKVSTVTLP